MSTNETEQPIFGYTENEHEVIIDNDEDLCKVKIPDFSEIDDNQKVSKSVINLVEKLDNKERTAHVENGSISVETFDNEMGELRNDILAMTNLISSFFHKLKEQNEVNEELKKQVGHLTSLLSSFDSKIDNVKTELFNELKTRKVEETVQSIPVQTVVTTAIQPVIQTNNNVKPVKPVQSNNQTVHTRQIIRRR